MAFVNLTASAIAATFTAAGFTRAVRNHEVVYERPHSNPKFKIVVYTSLTDGESLTRAVGADAIRAALVQVLNGRTYGVTSSTRVNRTGTEAAVLERALERAREMWAAASHLSKVAPCGCGSARYADSGRCIARCGGHGHQLKAA